MTTSLKTCFKCASEKPRTEFYAHSRMADGLLGKCKSCCRSDVSANRAANKDYYLHYDRNRPNKTERAAKAVEYQKTDRGKVVRAAASRNCINRWPGKRAAHIAVRTVLRNGRLVRPDECSACRITGRIEAHHCDYTMPLNVTWLCVGCHKQWHRENKPIYQNAA